MLKKTIVERRYYMKRFRIGFILIAIVLIVLGWQAYKEKEHKQQINTIINEQKNVNQIEVTDHRTNKVIWKTTSEADAYKEQYPLSHIESLEKSNRKIFNHQADYTITYKTNNKKLYSVEILRLNHKAKTIPHIVKPFLFDVKGDTYIIYWPEQNKVLEQSQNTQKLLKLLNE